jgi:hypothetical protein
MTSSEFKKNGTECEFLLRRYSQRFAVLPIITFKRALRSVLIFNYGESFPARNKK